MKKDKIIEAAKCLTTDEINELQHELEKLKKVKFDSKQRIKSIMLLARNDFHPVCRT